MKAIVFACFALFAVASAHTLNRDLNRNLITDIIQGIFNANKGKLANITIANIVTDHGEINNLNVLGVDKTNIDKLEANGPLSIDIKNATISLATVSYSADWILAGLEVPEIGLTADGAGKLTGTAGNIFATVSLDLSLNGLTPVLEDWSNLYIGVPTINANLAGNVNEAENNQVINEKLGGWLSANLPRIAEENKPALIEIINEIIAGAV